jgi:hypothetical protein
VRMSVVWGGAPLYRDLGQVKFMFLPSLGLI